MHTTEEELPLCRSLLREELAAAEVYEQALGTIPSQTAIPELNRICLEHREAAKVISQFMKQQEDSGGQAVLAQTPTADVLHLEGDLSALQALRASEVRSIEFYEDALRVETLSSEFRTMIISTLLMQTQEHIRALDRMLAPASPS